MEKVLFDTNMVIYLETNNYPAIEKYLIDKDVFTSVVTQIEVLGYKNITASEISYFTDFFTKTTILEISKSIVLKAIDLKQQHKMGLGDAIIAATAICLKLTLVTRDIEDFKWIKGLKIVNPID